MGGELSVVFAREYNQSEHSQQKKRWAVVTTSRVVLIICGIDPATRPSDPTAFPPYVTTGLTFDQANATAEQQNAPRFEHARIPRQWTIPLKPLSTDRVWWTRSTTTRPSENRRGHFIKGTFFLSVRGCAFITSESFRRDETRRVRGVFTSDQSRHHRSA